MKALTILSPIMRKLAPGIVLPMEPVGNEGFDDFESDYAEACTRDCAAAVTGCKRMLWGS
jgi:hypothetical protein